MTVTRAPDFSPAIADLFQAFNRCAEGHDAPVVLEAAANLLVCALVFNSQVRGESIDAALRRTQDVGEALPAAVARQWNRPVQPGDVKVPTHGN